jgi:hypothetical protein
VSSVTASLARIAYASGCGVIVSVNARQNDRKGSSFNGNQDLPISHLRPSPSEVLRD